MKEMVKNKCSKCRKDVEHTINVYTDKMIHDIDNDWWLNHYDSVHYLSDYRIVEHWCLPCLFRKAPAMGHRE